jgi:hypothetical protein
LAGVVFALESVVCAPLLDGGKGVEAKTGLGLVAPVWRLLLPSHPWNKKFIKTLNN